MKKLSQEEAESRILKNSKNQIRLVSTYLGNSKELVLQCCKCKNKWATLGWKITDGTNIICKLCKEQERKTPYVVYIHIFPNNKVYVGITSIGVKNRWHNGKGYKDNPYLNNAINKYGWNNIKHKILFKGLTREEASNKEIELIKQYKSTNKEYGYNICYGGVGVNKPNTTIILQYSVDGNFIKTFRTIQEASRETGVGYASIGRCISGLQFRAGNYMWRRINNNDDYPLKILPYNNNRGGFFKENNIQFGQGRGQKICQLDENKCIIKIWNSIIEASQFIREKSIKYKMCNQKKWKMRRFLLEIL